MTTLEKQILAHKDAPWFTVLDGAQFDDLPGALDALGLPKRALYFDDTATADPPTAPYIVALDPLASVIKTILNLVGPRPAAVFWRCPAGGGALFRHLRTINKILYPSELLAAERPRTPGPFSNDPTQTSHERVLFRHADANVMAQVAPALAPAQRARLLGPADRLVFEAGEDWGGLHEIEPIKGVDAPAGPLTLDSGTVDNVEAQARAATRRRIETHLREVAPEFVDPLTPEQLSALVVKSEVSGDAMGLTSEYGLGLWATLMAMTDGTLATNTEVTALIAAHPEGPDRAVEEALEQIGASTDADWDDL